jgi:hypothetical protein
LLSRVEQQNFQTHLASWLDFTNAASREDAQQDDTNPKEAFISIAKRVAELYTELGYEKPQIIPCSGPTEQIIFPGLVGMMLKLGREEAKESQFLRTSGMESGLEAGEWRSFWHSAYNSIDWARETSFDLTVENSLNSQIDVQMRRQVKNNLEAYVDQELGFEEHQIFEMICKRLMETPCTRIRSALSFNATETTSTWKSFMARIPAVSRKHFKLQSSRSNQNSLPLHQPNLASWMGRWDWYWLATADYAHKVKSATFPPSLDRLLNLWTSLAKDATSYLFSQHCCFVYLKPREAFFDPSWRLHHPDKAAAYFSDGTRFFFWHGIEVPEHVILKPKKIKLKMIEQERNVEVRRVMIERFGIDNFTLLAKKLHEDECGILYSKEMEGDEDLTVVKVINSTAEPDGTFKTYFLRVPPGTRTARAGVAWTFGLEEDEYEPLEET